MESYNLNAGPEFKKEGVAFDRPISASFAQKMRRGYFAATSFIDAQVGKVISALDAHGYTSVTSVIVWGDHGWHLGDTNSWCKMTNFETAARNTMLWRVPGQVDASKGLNQRVVESVDIFPTIVELAGLPALPACAGLDQPPTVHCVQGSSYAAEFLPASSAPAPPKALAFSQWPYPKWGPEKRFRQGYTVRSADGYRYTEYVDYNLTTFRGEWHSAAAYDDTELYDYNTDRWETTNFAAEPSHAAVAARLRAALLKQYAPPGSAALDGPPVDADANARALAAGRVEYTPDGQVVPSKY